MNILLVGSGGREHALAWKLAQSPLCTTIFAAPGNPGIGEHAQCIALQVEDHAAVTAFCKQYDVGLVVIGPEAPLVAGLADDLRAADIAVFGPSARAAQLEGSKGFTKDLCTAANIPTAAYKRFDTLVGALAGITDFKAPYVIKADGLAAGKGVTIAETHADAVTALLDMFNGSADATGVSVVIEEFLIGEEVSFFVLTDGITVVPFGSAQDHKRVGEGDTGPNTGGMGAYSPAAIFTPEQQAQVMAEIIMPTVHALADAGTPYCGVLFAGLMLTAVGPKLIEYNARFGDPECQALMLRFDGDLVALLYAVANGSLAEAEAPSFSTDTALTVVMAARGYPGVAEQGGKIVIGDIGQAKLFHAGTALVEEQLVARGGRVLSVTARGDTVSAAQASAYQAVAAINFPSGFCRHDIGWRAIARELES